jgi:Tol biopolymer transport system component
MVGPGCEPGWMPDGRVVWVSEDGGRERTGIFVSDANTGKIETLQDDDAPRGHEYFPTVTAEGRRLFWSACRPGQHAHTDFGSNYQIFSRRLPDGKPVRITFDGFNNRWPKLLNAAPVAP